MTWSPLGSAAPTPPRRREPPRLGLPRIEAPGRITSGGVTIDVATKLPGLSFREHAHSQFLAAGVAFNFSDTLIAARQLKRSLEAANE
jgi:hypothetical protein